MIDDRHAGDGAAGDGAANDRKNTGRHSNLTGHLIRTVDVFLTSSSIKSEF
jgi:hypothetical protein